MDTCNVVKDSSHEIEDEGDMHLDGDAENGHDHCGKDQVHFDHGILDSKADDDSEGDSPSSESSQTSFQQYMDIELDLKI